MPKYMNNKYMMNLQIFAEGETKPGGEPGEGGDPDDDPEEDPAKGGDDELKFTQADIDKAVARTIAKERAKAERAAKKNAQKDESSEETEDAKKRKEAEGRASKAEMKVACYEAGVAKDSVEDVAALAHAYMEADENLDFEDAIEKVVKKYPQFKKDSADLGEEDTNRGKAWGERLKSGNTKKRSGVEEAFLKRNPNLKID